MSENDFDIYGDLENFDLLEKFKLKNDDYKLLLEKYKYANDNLKKSEFEREQLQSKLANLEKSFGSLLITSRLEIKRKENQINELRKELDNVIFRRHVRRENESKDNSKHHLHEKKHEEEERRETLKLEKCNSKDSADRRNERDSYKNSRKRRRDSELDDRDKKRRRESLEKDSRSCRYQEKVTSRISTRSSSHRTDNYRNEKYERQKDVIRRDSRHRTPPKRNNKTNTSEEIQLRRSERSKNIQKSNQKSAKISNSPKKSEEEQKKGKVLKVLLEPLPESIRSKFAKVSPKGKDEKESFKSSEKNIKKIHPDILKNAETSVAKNTGKQVKSTDDKKALEVKNKSLLTTAQTSLLTTVQLGTNEDIENKLLQSKKKPNVAVCQTSSEISISINASSSKEFDDMQTRKVDKTDKTTILENNSKLQETPIEKAKCFEDILIDQLASEDFGSKYEEKEDCVKPQSNCLENCAPCIETASHDSNEKNEHHQNDDKSIEAVSNDSNEKDEPHEKPSQFFKKQDKFEEQEIKTDFLHDNLSCNHKFTLEEAAAIKTKYDSEMQYPLSNNVFVVIPHNVVNSVNSNNPDGIESHMSMLMPREKNMVPLMCENESEDKANNKNTIDHADLIQKDTRGKKNESEVNEIKPIEKEISLETDILSSKVRNEIPGTPFKAPEKDHGVFASTLNSNCTSTPLKLKNIFGETNDLTDSQGNSSKTFNSLERQMDDIFKENKDMTNHDDFTPIKGNCSEISSSKAKEMFDLYLASPVNIVPSEIEKDFNKDRTSSLLLASTKKRRSSTPRKSLSGRGVKLVGHRIDGFEPGIRGEKALEASKLKTALFKEIFGAEDSQNRSEETMNSTDKLEDIEKSKFDGNEISSGKTQEELLHFYIFDNTDEDLRRESISSVKLTDKDIYMNTNDNTLETPVKYIEEVYTGSYSRASNVFINDSIQKKTENTIELVNRNIETIEGASSILTNQNRAEEMLLLNRFEAAIAKGTHLSYTEVNCGNFVNEGSVETETIVESKSEIDSKQQDNEKNSGLNTVITTGEIIDSNSSLKSQEWKDENVKDFYLPSEMRSDKVHILSVISIKKPITIKRNLNQENTVILNESLIKTPEVSSLTKGSSRPNSDIAISDIGKDLNQKNAVPLCLPEIVPHLQAIDARNSNPKDADNSACKDGQSENIHSDISSDDENSNTISGHNNPYQDRPNILLNKPDICRKNITSQCFNENLETTKEIGIKKFMEDFCRTIENVEEETVSDSIRSHTSEQAGNVTYQLNTSFGKLCKLGNEQKISTSNSEKENIPQLIEPVSSVQDGNVEIYSIKQLQSPTEINTNVYDNKIPKNEGIHNMDILNVNVDKNAKTDIIENKEIQGSMGFDENFTSNCANEMIPYYHESESRQDEYLTDATAKNDAPLQQTFSSLLRFENSNELLNINTNDINTYAQREEVVEETPKITEPNTTASVKPVIRTISKKRKETFESPRKRKTTKSGATNTAFNPPKSAYANDIGIKEAVFSKSALTEGNVQKMLESFGQHQKDSKKTTLLKCEEKEKKYTRKKNNTLEANVCNQVTQALCNADQYSVRSPSKTATTNERRPKNQRTNNDSPTKQSIKKCDKKKGKSVIHDMPTELCDIPIEDELQIEKERNRREKLTEKYPKSAQSTKCDLDKAKKKKSTTKQSLKSIPAKNINVLNIPTPVIEEALEKKTAKSQEVSQNVKQVKTIQVEVAVKRNDPSELLCNNNFINEKGKGETNEENYEKMNSISDDLVLSTSDERSRNESTNMFNITGERKNISIASTNYIVESVSNDVVNVFITRRRKKK